MRVDHGGRLRAACRMTDHTGPYARRQRRRRSRSMSLRPGIGRELHRIAGRPAQGRGSRRRGDRTCPTACLRRPGGTGGRPRRRRDSAGPGDPISSPARPALAPSTPRMSGGFCRPQDVRRIPPAGRRMPPAAGHQAAGCHPARCRAAGYQAAGYRASRVPSGAVASRRFIASDPPLRTRQGPGRMSSRGPDVFRRPQPGASGAPRRGCAGHFAATTCRSSAAVTSACSFTVAE